MKRFGRERLCDLKIDCLRNIYISVQISKKSRTLPFSRALTEDGGQFLNKA